MMYIICCISYGNMYCRIRERKEIMWREGGGVIFMRTVCDSWYYNIELDKKNIGKRLSRNNDERYITTYFTFSYNSEELTYLLTYLLACSYRSSSCWNCERGRKRDPVLFAVGVRVARWYDPGITSTRWFNACVIDCTSWWYNVIVRWRE